MKVLYIHQYFKIPEEGGAIRSYHLSKALVMRGHKVSVLTSHNSKKYIQKNVEGIDVHYLPVTYKNSMGFYARGYAFLKFAWAACRYIRKRKIAFDICYASSTPLTVGIIALWIKKALKKPYYFEVRDLWPEAPVQMGVIKNPLLKKILYRLEKSIYKKAEKIVALSPGIKDEIIQKISRPPVYVIPNMSDCQFFKPDTDQADIFRGISLKNKFVIAYFGAAGEANQLSHLLDIARMCMHKHPQIIFLVAGKGSALPRIQSIAIKQALKNISFVPYGNKKMVRDLLHASHAVFVSFAPIPVLEKGSPNKFFDALAAGKLVILNFSGWLRSMVETKKCGFYVPHDDPEIFSEKITPFLADKTVLGAYQDNARKLAKAYFSRERLSKQFIEILES